MVKGTTFVKFAENVYAHNTDADDVYRAVKESSLYMGKGTPGKTENVSNISPNISHLLPRDDDGL